MRVSLTCIFALIGAAYASLREEITRDDAPTLTKIVQEIARAPSTHDVVIQIKDQWNNENVRRISETVSAGISASRIAYSFDITSDRVQSLFSGSKATTRTLLIYIYAGETATTNLKRTYIIQDMLGVINPNAKPRILLISSSRNGSENFREMLDFGWYHLALVDIAIIEVLRCDDFQDTRVYVHQWNPFSAVYKKELYRGGPIDFFPDKLRDIHGYTELVLMSNQDPYLTTSYNRSTGDFTIEGLTADYLRVVFRVMNATLYITADKSKAFISPVLLALSDHGTKGPFTVSLGKTRMCFCIPHMVKRATISLSNIAATAFVGLLLILIFRLFLVAFKLDVELGSIMNVVRLVFGAGTETTTVTHTGKVMFLCLVLAITRYSSMLYTEIFDLIVARDGEVKITSFEDLEALEWGMFVPNDVYNFLLKDFNIPPNLEKNIKVFSNEDKFYKALYSVETNENKVFFFNEFACEYFSLRVRSKNNGTVLKTADFCPVQMDLVYMLPIGSAYRDRVNEILLRVVEAQLNVAFDLNRTIKHDILLARNKLGYDNRNRSSDSFETRMTYVMLFGYFVSIVVAIGEIIMGWLRSRKLRSDEEAGFYDG